MRLALTLLTLRAATAATPNSAFADDDADFHRHRQISLVMNPGEAGGFDG